AVLARDHGELELQKLLRSKRARHAEDVSLDRVRGGAQRDLCGSPHSVAADTLEDKTTLSRSTSRGKWRVAQVAIRADREHVPERGLEFELDLHVDRVRVRVQDADPLAKAVRQEPR